MLECSVVSLPYYVQVDICHDVALAVAYLHSNDIIHRDLSSNNVLITARRRAKVTDFGMSKLAGAASSTTPLTMCPGTQAYMPPEALRDPPMYTKKLDCFSEGVIMIQLCTRLWPDPGPRTQLVHDSRSPTSSTEMPVIEQERRKKHIDMIDRTHGLLPIAIECLEYQEKERPSSEELCQSLANVKDTVEYRESLRQEQDDIQAKDGQTALLTQKLQVKEDRIQQLKKQLEEKEKATQQREENQLPKPQDSQKPPQTKAIKMAITGREDTKRRLKRGAAAVYGNMVYFMLRDGKVYSYNSTTKWWKNLPKYPYSGGSLAIINNSELIALGGCANTILKNIYHNDLLNLEVRDSVHTGWLDLYPPMPTKRRDIITLTTSEHLIAAGGTTGPAVTDQTTAVEVMNTTLLVWSAAACLTHLYRRASGTVCGDRLYILGGENGKVRTKSVLTCSLKELLKPSPSSLSSI